MEFKGKWLPEKDSFKKACVRLSKNMTNFKQDPDFIPFIGNDNRSSDVVNAFDTVVTSNYIKDNDRIGNPKLHNGKSAGTLRFMKVVEDVFKLFVGKPPFIDIKNIIEIGGGYGGQCLIFSKMFKHKTYSIIDIPEVLKLAKEYLNANKIDCNFISSEDVPKLKCDLLISDYCLSEFNKEGVCFYLDRIEFNYGYFTINGNLEMITNELKSRGYKIFVMNEYPKTSHHNNYILNCYK